MNMQEAEWAREPPLSFLLSRYLPPSLPLSPALSLSTFSPMSRCLVLFDYLSPLFPPLPIPVMFTYVGKS